MTSYTLSSIRPVKKYVGCTGVHVASGLSYIALNTFNGLIYVC